MADKKAFFIKKRGPLIQNVKNVESIVDDLISSDQGFHAELSAKVSAENTDPARMRKILDSVTSNALAEVLFNALLKHQNDVMVELLEEWNSSFVQPGPPEPKITDSLSVPDGYRPIPLKMGAHEMKSGKKRQYPKDLEDEVKPHPIKDTKEQASCLRKQFDDLVEHMKNREGKELFRVEYGKNASMAFRDVKSIQQLMVRGKSVCQVRVEGKAAGSGFLLFDKFILTNAHVIEHIFDVGRKQLTQEVSVSFCFEDLGARLGLLDNVPVKRQVVVFEKLTDHSGCSHDFALLELDSEPDSDLTGLLSNFVTSASTRGGICIIGHPDGGVKKLDTCFTIPVGDRVKLAEERYQENLQLITHQFFQHADSKHLVNQSPDLAYDTCFFFGSSGSPVFDGFCNVVAVHSGGYAYTIKGGQTQSLIEFAQPLSRILPRILIQIVDNKRFDVLEAYLHYTSIHKNATWDQVKEDVKRIVERQNLKEFENILKNYDGDLKIMEFKQFFCPQDNSEPMVINLLDARGF